jgi:hypothetical protein
MAIEEEEERAFKNFQKVKARIRLEIRHAHGLAENSAVVRERKL